MISKHFIFFLILLLKARNGSSFRCYQCNSFENEGCEVKPIREEYLKDCPSRAPCENLPYENDINEKQGCLNSPNITFSQIESKICRTIEIQIHGDYSYEKGDLSFFTRQTKTRVIRQCGYWTQDEHDTTCKRTGGSFTTTLTCSCTKDSCNFGTRNNGLNLSILLMSMSIITIFRDIL